MTQVTYFKEKGPGNTDAVLQLARQRAEELGIDTVVVATSRGRTALAARQILGGRKLVVVTHSTGFKAPDAQELPEEVRRQLIEGGAAVLTTAHAFGGIGRAIRRKLNTYQADEVIAHTLRIFGQGTKVACEVTLMAADAGLVRTDADVIAIGGSDEGCDTALVLKPAHTQDFFDLRVREIICKPRQW